MQFFLDEAVKAGFEEILPPLLVNEDSARGTGQLPDKEAQMYHCERDNLYLIPTARVRVLGGGAWYAPRPADSRALGGLEMPPASPN